MLPSSALLLSVFGFCFSFFSQGAKLFYTFFSTLYLLPLPLPLLPPNPPTFQKYSCSFPIFPSPLIILSISSSFPLPTQSNGHFQCFPFPSHNLSLLPLSLLLVFAISLFYKI
jgi:hypothetical protein